MAVIDFDSKWRIVTKSTKEDGDNPLLLTEKEFTDSVYWCKVKDDEDNEFVVNFSDGRTIPYNTTKVSKLIDSSGFKGSVNSIERSNIMLFDRDSGKIKAVDVPPHTVYQFFAFYDYLPNEPKIFVCYYLIRDKDMFDVFAQSALIAGVDPELIKKTH